MAVVAVASVGILLAGAGAAFAYFTSTGTGTGTGSVGTANGFTVAVGTPTGGMLYPGIGTETFSYTVTNSGSGNQELNTVTISVAPDAAALAATPVPCQASWYQIDSGTDSTTESPATDLAPGGVFTSTFTLDLTDMNTNQDGCEGDAPVVTVAASL